MQRIVSTILIGLALQIVLLLPYGGNIVTASLEGPSQLAQNNQSDDKDDDTEEDEDENENDEDLREEVEASKKNVQEFKAAKNDPDRLSKLKVFAAREADHRTKRLTQLLTQVEQSQFLTATDKVALVAAIQAQLAGVADLKSQVEASQSLDALTKSRSADIVSKHPVFTVTEPKFRGLVTANFASQILQRANNMSDQLNRVVERAKAAGLDTTTLASQITTFDSYLAAARAKVETAQLEFAKMDSSNPTAAKTALEAGKTALKDAKAQLALARDTLKSIASALKPLESSTASPSIFPSVSLTP